MQSTVHDHKNRSCCGLFHVYAIIISTPGYGFLWFISLYLCTCYCKFMCVATNHYVGCSLFDFLVSLTTISWYVSVAVVNNTPLSILHFQVEVHTMCRVSIISLSSFTAIILQWWSPIVLRSCLNQNNYHAVDPDEQNVSDPTYIHTLAWSSLRSFVSFDNFGVTIKIKSPHSQ